MIQDRMVQMSDVLREEHVVAEITALLKEHKEDPVNLGRKIYESIVTHEICGEEVSADNVLYEGHLAYDPRPVNVLEAILYHLDNESPPIKNVTVLYLLFAQTILAETVEHAVNDLPWEITWKFSHETRCEIRRQSSNVVKLYKEIIDRENLPLIHRAFYLLAMNKLDQIINHFLTFQEEDEYTNSLISRGDEEDEEEEEDSTTDCSFYTDETDIPIRYSVGFPDGYPQSLRQSFLRDLEELMREYVELDNGIYG